MSGAIPLLPHCSWCAQGQFHVFVSWCVETSFPRSLLVGLQEMWGGASSLAVCAVAINDLCLRLAIHMEPVQQV